MDNENKTKAERLLGLPGCRRLLRNNYELVLKFNCVFDREVLERMENPVSFFREQLSTATKQMQTQIEDLHRVLDEIESGKNEYLVVEGFFLFPPK